MKIPTRLLVLQRLTAHLEALSFIIPAMDAATPELPVDLQGRVFRGRNLFGEEVRGQPYLLSILEAPRPDVASEWMSDKGLRDSYWTLMLQGRVEDNPIMPTDRAYHLAAAVESHLWQVCEHDRDTGLPKFPGAFNLGGAIADFQIGDPVIRPPEDKLTGTAFFFIALRVRVLSGIDRVYTDV